MDRVERLLAELTLEQKLALTAGDDLWHTVRVDGVPRVKVTDGPSGARGERFTGARSASFPCGAAIAATWNPALVADVGRALAAEAEQKGAHVLLGPTVNIHRHPLAGRNFECYSEDPFLAARVAAAYITGLQGEGVGACIKHFVCNDQEHERHSISAVVDERTLREIYLPPFEAGIREAGAWSVMAAYNRLDGTHCTEHPGLLRDVLADEWSFDGVVVSDWFATKSGAASLNAGLHLEMPGPGAHMGTHLEGSDEVATEAVDDAARRILRLAERTGALDAEAEPVERSTDDPDVRAVARRCAREAIVLLRNTDDALPLEGVRRLAVIGPNADVPRVQGGGSAQVNPHPTKTILEAIRGRDVEVVFERGCWNDRGVPPVDGRWLADGLEVVYEPGGVTETAPRGRFVWLGPPAPGVEQGAFSARVTGTLLPDHTGDWTFALTNAGRAELVIDGATVVDNTEPERGTAFFGLGSTEATGIVHLEAGRRYELDVDFRALDGSPLSGLQLGCRPPIPDDLTDRAVDAARGADAAVVVVGSTEDWETEGTDRADMRLPGPQDELVRRVAEANPRTIVVVNAGSPHEMPWAEDVAGVVQGWYLGEEQGPAIADVLFGDANPSGKLPTTFPRRLTDAPTHAFYPGEEGEVVYGEGVFVGYRGFDRDGIEPLFPFGHGLSYTAFEYGSMRVEPADPVRVSVDVTNAGERPGAEVVQVYVSQDDPSVPRPPKELKAFEKVALEPGETRTVTFQLDRRAFSFWTPDEGWTLEPGTFRIAVGSSSRDLPLEASVELDG